MKIFYLKSRRLVFIFLVTVTLNFIDCSKISPIAGGTSETTNGDLQASLTHSNGTPAARVKVLLIDDTKWLVNIADGKPVTLDSAVTDDSGHFSINIPFAKRCNLQIDGQAEGLLLREANTLIDIHQIMSNRKFKLAAFASLAGSITLDSGVAQELQIAGTTYKTKVNSNGAYAFSHIAAGTFSLIAQVNLHNIVIPSLTQSLNIAAGNKNDSVNLHASISNIPIDDFEQGWKQTTFGRIIGNGLWYSVTDIKENGNSSIRIENISDSEAYSGSSLRAEYILGNKIASPWSIMGFNIGNALQGDVYDFTDVRALSFWAKGKGIINVKFLSKTISRLFQDSTQFYYPLSLPTQWTHFTIPVDSLRLPKNALPELKNYTWKQVASEMQTLDFTAEKPESKAGDTVVLWLDNIYFEGLSLKNFIK